MIPIRDIVRSYSDNGEDGVIGYGGLLDVRPPYQREFVYKEKQRNAVIKTVMSGFPLNIMYWAKTGETHEGEDKYEILDGQQRTISICQYFQSDFAIKDENGNNQYFHNLTPEQKNTFLDYELTIYKCDGTTSEKLDWFKVVNIAGEPLTEQELRNAVYAGSWLEDAKRYFSKSNAPARDMSDGLVKGNPLRQEYLETALNWITHRDNTTIEDYMARHQNDLNANELWLYFSNVISWVNVLFSNKRSEMKNVKWGYLYNEYKDNQYDSTEIEAEIVSLMLDDDVTNKSGIYSYIFSRDEKNLNIRKFSKGMKRGAYERQQGVCVECKKHFSFEKMEGDHITPWIEGGKTNVENCQMLCVNCNRRKSKN